jgi:hypothetical protein
MKYLIFLSGCLLFSSCHLDPVEPADSCATASFETINDGCQAPCTVEFRNTSTNAINPRWDFGDGTTSTESSPQHYYAVSGDYTVRLTVDCPTGGEDQFSLPVSVRPITFIQEWSVNGSDYGKGVRELPAGGYVVCGYTNIDNLNTDGLLYRTNALGEKLVDFPVQFGASKREYADALELTGDGHVVIAGSTSSFDGIRKGYLLSFTVSGLQLFEKVYDADDHTASLVSIDTAGDGYVMAGYAIVDPVASSTDLFVVKTDPLGETPGGFVRTFTAPTFESGTGICATADGGYLVAGYAESDAQPPSFDVYLLKLDAQGNPAPGFPTRIGGALNELANAVEPTADGGYIIVGEISTPGPAAGDILLIKTDAAGDVIFTRSFGGPGDQYAEAVAQTTDGGYVLTGHTSAGGGDILLVRTNSNGDELFARTFGSTGSDYGEDVRQTADGGFVIVGTIEPATDVRKVYLIKTDKDGNVQ